MGKIRKNYSGSFKAKVALEAAKKDKTISQLSSEYGVHSNQIQLLTIPMQNIHEKEIKKLLDIKDLLQKHVNLKTVFSLLQMQI